MVLAVTRFETSRMLKLSCSIAPYGLGSMPPDRSQLVQVLPRVLTQTQPSDASTMETVMSIGREPFSGKHSEWADVKIECVSTIANAGYSYITQWVPP